MFLLSNLFDKPHLFVQNVINGLQLGFVYGLIALGYTMVYGIVKLINFAHGDVFMVGAFVSFFAVEKFQLHQWPLKVIPSYGSNAGDSNWYSHNDLAIHGDLCVTSRHHRTGSIQTFT